MRNKPEIIEMTLRTSLAIGALLLAVTGPVAAQGQQGQGSGQGLPPPPSGQALGTANLIGQDGKPRGTAAFVETPAGTLIQVRLNGIPVGVHGIHIHETGQCQGPDFKSAGGHYNPGGQEHGLLAHAQIHAGDLPNVYAHDNGVVWADILTPRVTLGTGQDSLFSQNGTAIVVHATPDDYATNPAGASGDRIACGVIERTTQPK
ncbi:superoxide dismutase family protein [Azospirillum sp. SYSU D00513]|uniref:superoxide dismutase family protein n=1 Tax=Azospirillum sp. SYSU D00513 TaxID=2812561 RepID=UPI001A97A350|nr:superoxide dismutase family protein [Azospirillum sp. SYSU D00513]